MSIFPTSIRLPADLRMWLVNYAEQHGMTHTRLIVWVLQQFRKHVESGEKK